MYAEKEGRQAYIDTLNQFFDAIAAPFNRNGGEILSFLGDGFLAVYPCGRHKDPSKIACEAALSAVHHAQSRVAELNKDREAKGLPKIGYGIGLHVGNVMFGNVGLKDRLTFSAFGSAVNEVQRLQVLTKKYSREVVASQAFAGYCGGEWITLGEEKLRGIRQKVTVLQPRAPASGLHVDEGFREIRSERPFGSRTGHHASPRQETGKTYADRKIHSVITREHCSRFTRCTVHENPRIKRLVK